MADKWNAKQRHVRQRQKNCSDPSNCKVWVIVGAGGWNKAVGGWCLHFQVQLIKIEYNKTIWVLEFIQTGFNTLYGWWNLSKQDLKCLLSFAL